MHDCIRWVSYVHVYIHPRTLYKQFHMHAMNLCNEPILCTRKWSHVRVFPWGSSSSNHHSPYISVGVSAVMAVGIQGKVDICIQGQRLNQTKEERAGVVYGADHRLSWTVAAPMPKIVVSQSSTASMQPQLQLFPYVYMYGFTCTCTCRVLFAWLYKSFI